MSFIGSMVAVGVLGLEAGSLAAIATGAAVTGAGIGAGIGAATGGDIGDAALMGGIGGLAAGAGAGMMMGAGAAAGEGAAAGAGAAAGEGAAAGAGAATGAGEAAATGAATGAGEAAATGAATGAGEAAATGAATGAGEAAATGAATGAGEAAATGAGQGIAQLQAQALANSSPLINTAHGTLNTALGQAQTVVPQMSSNALAQGGGQGIAQLQAQALANSSPLINTAHGTLNTALGQAQTVVPQMSSNALAQGGGNAFLSGIDSTIASRGAELAAHPELSYGQQAVQALTGAAPNSATVQYGGSALQGMATGAGVQGISNAVTGRPITEGMGTSAIAGGIGGAASTGLVSQAGTGGALGAAGDFAKAHNIITPMGISMLASPMVDVLANSGQDTTAPNTKGIKPDFRYDTAAYRRKSNPVMYAHGGDVVQPSGISTLGGYSDGGRLLKGPGDGVSDSIPAIIGNKEPARLAEGEFVIPARIVSELGNGSTDAGAKQLYAMMDRVQHSRHRTMGKGKFAEDTHAKKHLPA